MHRARIQATAGDWSADDGKPVAMGDSPGDAKVSTNSHETLQVVVIKPNLGKAVIYIEHVYFIYVYVIYVMYVIYVFIQPTWAVSGQNIPVHL